MQKKAKETICAEAYNLQEHRILGRLPQVHGARLYDTCGKAAVGEAYLLYLAKDPLGIHLLGPDYQVEQPEPTYGQVNLHLNELKLNKINFGSSVFTSHISSA